MEELPAFQTLSSLWDGLSPHLLAHFYEVARQDNQTWARTSQTDPYVVIAPLTEGNMEMTLNWQSPFEQAGPESSAPALMAMLQSGSLKPVVDAFMGSDGQEESGTAQQRVDAFVSQFEGRAGVTKLNSTQVFSGMPPVKFQITVLLRAWRNAAQEVEAPLDKLMQWALPVELSRDGSILARLAQAAQGERGHVETLMPSRAPICIAMQYKGRTWSPLVIESVGVPITSPINVSGHYIELAVPLTLATLTAVDRADWMHSRL